MIITDQKLLPRTQIPNYTLPPVIYSSNRVQEPDIGHQLCLADTSSRFGFCLRTEEYSIRKPLIRGKDLADMGRMDENLTRHADSLIPGNGVILSRFKFIYPSATESPDSTRITHKSTVHDRTPYVT